MKNITVVKRNGLVGVVLGKVRTNAAWRAIQNQTPVKGESFFNFRPFDGGSASIQMSRAEVIETITKEEALERYIGPKVLKQYYEEAIREFKG